MPIEHSIDPERRRVVARAVGALTDEEVLAYQAAVWSRPEVAGFDELIDMRAADPATAPGPGLLRRLAALAAGMDAVAPTRLAIVAASDLVYGLGRMYEAYRESDRRSRRDVNVFRTLEEATAYLDRSRGDRAGRPDSS